MSASVIRLPALTRSSASIPSSDLPVSLGLPSSVLSTSEANQFVDFTCRYGSHFDRPASAPVFSLMPVRIEEIRLHSGYTNARKQKAPA